MSLHPVGPPHPPFGDIRYLRLPAKHGEHSFSVSEGVMNPKTRLVGVAVGTLNAGSKAHPQQ
jgi:hypothetical protein